METVIENVGSLLQDVANNIDDTEDKDNGFTSLLSARNDSVHFPQSYDVPGMIFNNISIIVKKFILAVNLIITSGHSTDM